MADEALTFMTIGDPHFKVSNVVETNLMHEQLDRFLKETPLDMIVVLGDTLDTHERLHLMVLSRAIAFIRMLLTHAPVYLLIGNHDRINNSDFLSDVHPFVGMNDEGLVVVSHVETATIKGRKLVFVPYVPPGQFEAALKTATSWSSRGEGSEATRATTGGRGEHEGCSETGGVRGAKRHESQPEGGVKREDQAGTIPASGEQHTQVQTGDDVIPIDITQASLIFAHQEFRGCQMGAIVSEIGDPWPLDYPTVISGHIHNYHVPQPNIIYTGTPLQHAFGDTEDKRILVFEHRREPVAQPVAHQCTDGYLVMRSLVLDVDRKVIVRKTIAELDSFSPPPGCQVKLVITGTSEEIRAIKTRKLSYPKTKIFYHVIENTEREIVARVSEKDLSFEEVLLSLLDQNECLTGIYRQIIAN
jgi:DNA repair exonuclease SbcCD nuclease subunit